MSIGIFGIPNMGNTCYINSIIQILLHTPYFNYILQNTQNLKNNNMENIIVKQWIEFYTKTVLYKSISPHNLIYSIRKYIKKLDNNQQDASEFLIQLIDIFKIALARPVRINISNTYGQNKNNLYIECYKRIQQLYSNEYSELVDIFNGMLITEIKYLNKNIISRTFDSYSILQLPTPNIKISNIYNCLDLLWSTETLTDYTIDSTNIFESSSSLQNSSITNMVVLKTYYLWLTPKILILNLKKYNTHNKFNTYIDIPHNLNLTKYLYDGCTDKPIYTLYAICNHDGDMNQGHYYSYIFIQHLNKWVIFNDSHIMYINENQVSTKNAVCVFYRKLG
jgi:ubiquitin carboxyl-terminal hydrolase 8